MKRDSWLCPLENLISDSEALYFLSILLDCTTLTISLDLWPGAKIYQAHRWHYGETMGEYGHHNYFA